MQTLDKYKEEIIQNMRSVGTYKDSFANTVDAYGGITEGRKIACRELKQGCRRFLRDLENPTYDFNPKDAEFVIQIIEKTLCHVQGEKLDGTPLHGSFCF